MSRAHFTLPTFVMVLLASTSLIAAEVTVLSSKDPGLAMAPVTLPSGKVVNYTLGIGSGAHRHPSDPADVVWTVGDRGPNMTCSEAIRLIGPETKEPCEKVRAGRIYPTPAYVPSIYKVQLDRTNGSFRLLETITLKTKSGKPISGLLNPQTKASKDTGLDMAGNVLADNADNFDLEGIVRLSDGTFWVADEMGPSIALLSADGRILKRHVPMDAAEDYKASEAEIVANLPAVLSKRAGNRGFEAIAISPDEQFLYTILQNPLANPDARTYQNAKNSRIFKIERATGKLVGEYVYRLDDPMSFGADPSDKQNDPRISEMSALGMDRLLVLERTEKTTKLHEITLAGATNILGSKWDDAATRPSLEASNDLAGTDIVAVTKTLRFDSFKEIKDAPEKIEGIAFLGDGTLMLINDNDFAIRGDETKVILVKGAVTADRSVYTK
ncbi:MAG: esterase-like activity of phytase family protein [Beijerinckiaceae bacterium]